MHVVGLRAGLSHVVAGEKKDTVQNTKKKKKTYTVLDLIKLYASALRSHNATYRGKLETCKNTYL